MRILFLGFFCSCLSAGAQKPSNTFFTLELGNRTKGMSLGYNHRLFNTKLGVGASLEFIDISQQKLGGIMPSFDLRYYVRAGRSTFIPLAQVGYNLYRFSYAHADPNLGYRSEGGIGYSAGLGYAYQMTKSGGGPFVSLKYRTMHYRLSSPVLPGKSKVDGLKVGIGWKF